MSDDEEITGGTLTWDIIDRALNALWNCNESSQRKPRQFDGLLAVLHGEPPSCGVMLFAPDEGPIPAIRYELIRTGTPVHPLDAAWLNAPLQGPRLAACAREPHPDSPWHWDGRGTWWR